MGMKSLFAAFFSLFLTVLAFAQRDTVEVMDSTKKEVNFLQLGLMVDYGKLGTYFFADYENKLEGGIELLLLEKFPLTLEAGTADRNPKEGYYNIDYLAEGNYLRLGLGYRAEIDLRSFLTLGIKYGIASYKDEGTVRIESEFNQPYRRTFSRQNLHSNWFEIALTSEQFLRLKKEDPEARINRLLSWGVHFRLRIMGNYDGFDAVDAFFIPGYGRTQDRSIPAANLFFKINL
jgi:hypothetical protein